jgi:hypothetical protein
MIKPVRERPPLLRALGRDGPPDEVEIAGSTYRQVEIFKHDSWAATALYRGPAGEVVCKFNRVQPIFCVPMAWLGRRLASREGLALKRLAGVPGIPAGRGPVFAGGKLLTNTVAHAFVPGRPLSAGQRLHDDFFPNLLRLLREVHRRGMAYVDLHKRENIVVGEDGRPYLIDFQVCYGLWRPPLSKGSPLAAALRALQQADLYHFAKHVSIHRPDQLAALGVKVVRPSWIDVHRKVAAPLRQLRRRLLAAIGVRGTNGQAATEAFPEHAIRCEKISGAA